MLLRFYRPYQHFGRQFSRALQTIPNKPSFPCLDKVEQRTNQLKNDKIEPSYSGKRDLQYKVLYTKNLHLDYGFILPEAQVAYETWGTLNADKSNAILLFTGLSASSHAKSNDLNPADGWWENFIGPGLSIDTNKYFVICANVLGGCYGTTGPSSYKSPGTRWATEFPIFTINDVSRLQYKLVCSLGIKKLYGVVGSSMGGMTSLAFATDYPHMVGRVASISGCARSHPSSIALRHVQRQALMNDPNWNRGYYYDDIPPHSGMKLARQFATITYRSGPEWEERFGIDRADPDKPPAFCPDYLIETYLDHQGEKFCLQYDPNSLLYISKAMDMFDLGAKNATRRAKTRGNPPQRQDILPAQPYEEKPNASKSGSNRHDLVQGMRPMADVPVFVLGVQSDYLFPAWQQREIFDVLSEASPANRNLEYVELGYDISKFGHDTFLLQTKEVGGPLKAFLEKEF